MEADECPATSRHAPVRPIPKLRLFVRFSSAVNKWNHSAFIVRHGRVWPGRRPEREHGPAEPRWQHEEFLGTTLLWRCVFFVFSAVMVQHEREPCVFSVSSAAIVQHGRGPGPRWHHGEFPRFDLIQLLWQYSAKVGDGSKETSAAARTQAA